MGRCFGCELTQQFCYLWRHAQRFFAVDTSNCSRLLSSHNVAHVGTVDGCQLLRFPHLIFQWPHIFPCVEDEGRDADVGNARRIRCDGLECLCTAIKVFVCAYALWRTGTSLRSNQSKSNPEACSSDGNLPHALATLVAV